MKYSGSVSAVTTRFSFLDFSAANVSKWLLRESSTPTVFHEGQQTYCKREVINWRSLASRWFVTSTKVSYPWELGSGRPSRRPWRKSRRGRSLSHRGRAALLRQVAWSSGEFCVTFSRRNRRTQLQFISDYCFSLCSSLEDYNRRWFFGHDWGQRIQIASKRKIKIRPNWEPRFTALSLGVWTGRWKRLCMAC